MLLVCWLDAEYNFGRPGIWLLLLGLGIAAVAAWEFASLVNSAGHGLWKPVVALAALLPIVAAGVPIVWLDYPVDCPFGPLGLTLLALAAGFGLLFVVEMIRYQAPGSSAMRVALGLMTIVYIGLPFALLGHLRKLSPKELGLVAILSVIVIVKVSDAGAYFVGRSIGRNRLAPRLSPGKTIEGAIGGLIAGSLAGWGFLAMVAQIIPAIGAVEFHAVPCLAYGLVLTLAGMLGDLAESLIKRDVGQKDSSEWLPGLGGSLDVVDSVLFAAPVAFVWWSLELIGSST